MSNQDPKLAKRRREFLGWLGASTLVAATGSPLGAQSTLAARSDTTAPRPVDDKWDMSWVDRIRGDARAVFDSPSVSEGGAIWRAVSWREDYRQVYGTELADITAILIIRHQAIELAMGDEYWARFEVGKSLKIKDHDTEKWALVNPIRAATAGGSGEHTDYSLEGFMRTGGIVLACHRALVGRVVGKYSKADKLTYEEAEARARAQLVPGVILQPSGIFAALRAQQAGCQYIVAS